MSKHSGMVSSLSGCHLISDYDQYTSVKIQFHRFDQACSINKQVSSNLDLIPIAKVPLRLGLSPQIFSGQIGTDKHMLEASVK